MLRTEEEVINGLRLRVARLGKGQPLILLHGYPENLQIWGQMAPLLSDRFEVIAFDWPGLGYSDAWPGGASPQEMAVRLLELMDHWKLQQPLLVGQDVGGPPALLTAAEHPDRVLGLVILNSLAMSHVESASKLLRKPPMTGSLISRLPGMTFRKEESACLPSDERLPADVRNDFAGSFERPPVRALVQQLSKSYAQSLPQVSGLYPQIRCPSLLLWGAEDRLAPQEQGRLLQNAMAGARMQVVTRGHHWMVWHLPEIIAAHVRQFARGDLNLDTAV